MSFPASRRAHLRAVLLLVPLAIVTTTTIAAPSTAAVTSARGVWTRPVPGALVRPFDAPNVSYGPGHRGVDLRAAPGESVRAPAAGVVDLAGPVAGGLHVVLRVADGSRVALSFLARVEVVVGDRVAAGAEVGRAGGTGGGHRGDVVHLSWRVAGRYRDPSRRLAPRAYRLEDPAADRAASPTATSGRFQAVTPTPDPAAGPTGRRSGGLG